MATYTKNLLSESTDGRSILVELSASPGNLIHTAVGSVTGADEVWLYASNPTTADSILTLNWGTSGNRDEMFKIVIQAYAGPILIIPGLVLNNSAQIYCRSSTLSGITITGYVNRIS